MSYRTAKRQADAYTDRTGQQAFVYRTQQGFDWVTAHEYYHYRTDIKPYRVVYSTFEGEYED